MARDKVDYFKFPSRSQVEAPPPSPRPHDVVSAIHESGIGVWIWNIQANQMEWTRRNYALYGVRPETAVTFEAWLSRIHPQDITLLNRTLESALNASQGNSFCIEIRLSGLPERPPRWVEVQGRVEFDDKYKPLRFLGTTREVTPKRSSEELEQLVQARTSELMAMNQELEAFSYSVSHDLRTPLRSIDGFSQSLLEDEAGRLSDRGREDLKRITDAGRTMGCLIDDLLTLSRLSRKEILPASMNLSVLVSQVAESLSACDLKRQVDWVIHPTADVVADAGLMHVVLTNLLENAWKFTSKCDKAQIEFGSLGRGHGTIFFVRDNGAGFNMAYLPKLFGAFQRLHRADEFPGNGIGLATVRRVIHRHGGRVWAESQIDHGATFFFTIASFEEGQ